MSSEPSPQTDASTAPNQPARNPVERIFVWGLILVLLGIIGVEATARITYGNSLNNLEAALAKDEAGDPLTLDEVAGHISGFPNRQDDPHIRAVTYTWKGLLREYGSITLQYSRDKEVTRLETAEPPPEEESEPAEEEQPSDPQVATAENESEGGGGGNRGDRGGRGDGGERGEGGRRSFDPMQFDTDEDDMISRDEAPERMLENFDEIDTNGDGLLDRTELEARRAAFQRDRGGREGGRSEEGGDRPRRPQRPPLDEAGEDADTEESTEESAGTDPATDEDQ